MGRKTSVLFLRHGSFPSLTADFKKISYLRIFQISKADTWTKDIQYLLEVELKGSVKFSEEIKSL